MTRSDAVQKLDTAYAAMLEHRRLLKETSDVEQSEATTRFGLSALEGLDAVRAWLRALKEEPR